MVLVGDSPKSRFSYFEYQVFMLCLAAVICAGIATVDLVLNRFQVLPLLFPGVFSVRDRRFYFFTYDISDGALGKRVRGQAKMLIRMNLCVVLSYLWQHCVLETTQTVGSEFPKDECEDELDCFASKLHVDTFFTWRHEALDCGGPQIDFPSRVVVSCIRFIPPSATTWLMHLAIAHSVTQLNFKAYEVLVWIAGNSLWIRRLLGALIFVSLSVFVGLFLSGIVSEFVSSWLSFVMSLSVPVFLQVVWKSGKILELLWKAESARLQHCIEDNLDNAFRDIEKSVLLAEEVPNSNFKLTGTVPRTMGVTKTGFSSMMQRFVAGIRRPQLPHMPHMPNILRKGRSCAEDTGEPLSPTSPTLLVAQDSAMRDIVEAEACDRQWTLPDSTTEALCLRERLPMGVAEARLSEREDRHLAVTQHRSKSTSPRSGSGLRLEPRKGSERHSKIK